MLRTARANHTQATGGGGSSPLYLPQLEGRVIVPQYVQLGISGDPAATVGIALSYNRDWIPEPDALGTIIKDPSIWVFDHFDVAGAELAKRIDLRGYEIELGGPQSLCCYNVSGNNVEIYAHLWYEIKMVGDLHWADVARRTSYRQVAG